MEFYKNILVENVMQNYYSTFAKTIDTIDFVPEKYAKKINSVIYREMKRSLKFAERKYKRYRAKKFFCAFLRFVTFGKVKIKLKPFKTFDNDYIEFLTQFNIDDDNSSAVSENETDKPNDDDKEEPEQPEDETANCVE